MDPLKQEIPPDVPLEQQRSTDDKLRWGAEKARQIREAKQAAGLPSTVREAITAQESVLALVPRDTPRDHIVRVTASEGDQPPISDAVKAALIAKRFEFATFDNYIPVTRSQEAGLNAAKFWADRALQGECAMLALIGNTGAGKSHLLYAAANALLKANRRCYSRPWYRLADELRYGGESPFVPGRALESHDVRSMLWKQKLVMLDEVRPTASTAFDDTELAKFACHAYDSHLAVFITTNVSPLADVMGPPAASRFTQIVVEGPDRRQA